MSTNYAKMSTVILKKKLESEKITSDEKKAINAVIKSREKQIPDEELKQTKIKFKTRKGEEVSGLIVSIIVGKKDGKTYYGVRDKNDKLCYKQKDAVTIVSTPEPSKKKTAPAAKKSSKKKEETISSAEGLL